MTSPLDRVAADVLRRAGVKQTNDASAISQVFDAVRGLGDSNRHKAYLVARYDETLQDAIERLEAGADPTTVAGDMKDFLSYEGIGPA